ncbi:hypothetical protein NDU88_001750 [Pleurodeles waltl]|uniref:Uncharacterized protein n=1 Tax=Pleurodeles waltl TaxID=8319 RepID=A0AAV7WLJ7_PLEWA|nr:hypothetical protein NDU88_001750 [Pleurodeles waltl]
MSYLVVFCHMVMKLIIVDNLNRPELQRHCRERELIVGKKASNVDMQTTVQAYENVKRMQAATVKDDPKEDMDLNKDEKQDPESDPEL